MIRFIALLLPLALVVGCGGDSNPPTEPVTGTVTLDGQPFEGAVITFKPDDSSNRSAVATSQADGTYALTTFASGDGAQIGTYKIMVFKYDLPDGGQNPYEQGQDAGEIKEMTQEEELAAMESGYSEADAGPQGKEKKAKNFLPEKYADVTTSGLTYEVVAGGGEMNIELTSK
ncbi:MAG: hypothetical protein ACE361_14555 [Aureliella sp.]